MKLPSRILAHTVVQSGTDLPDGDHPFVVRTTEISRPLAKSHMHQGIELGTVTQGSGLLYWCGTQIKLGAGDCYYTNAMIPHFTGATPAGKFLLSYAHITAETIMSIRPQHLGTRLLASLGPRASQPVPVIRNRKDIAGLLCSAATLMESPDDLRWARAWVALLQAITLIIEHQQLLCKSEKPDIAVTTQPEFLFAGMAFIQQHFRESLTVNQIARHCCVSPSHLAHSFATHLGCSPVNYRNSIRIQYAIEEILTGTKSIEVIADSCGFQSIANFNRLFRKRAGCAPSSLRRGGKKSNSTINLL